MSKTLFTVLLCSIAFLGFFLRTYNIAWDHGHHLHPDERAIYMSAEPLMLPSTLEEFLTPESPLNPHFFAYGNFPIYLLKGVSYVAGIFNPFYSNYDGIIYVGRSISALADTLTIFTIASIAHIIFKKRLLTLLTALTYSIAVLPIQSSHFFIVDTTLTLFIMLTLLWILKYFQRPKIFNLIIMGTFFGFALASKTSALPLIIPLVLVVLIEPYKKIPSLRIQLSHVISRKNAKILATSFFKTGILITVTALIFFVTQPYNLIDFQTFLQQQIEQSRMTKSAFTFPYTLQYVGITPYLYPLKNIYFWGLGPINTAFAGAGLFLIFHKIYSHWKSKQTVELGFILLFFFIYFGIVGGFAVGWMRYMLPLYPLLCLFAAVYLFALWSTLHKKFTRKMFLSVTLSDIIFGLVIILMFIWPLSFMHIYTQPHSRVEASKWIRQNIPPGSVLSQEHWDDNLPLGGIENYSVVELPFYDVDTPEKWNLIEERLNQTDYIIFSSNRLYTPLQKLTDCKSLPPGKCYPQTARFYQRLFNHELNFEKVAEFTSFPKIPILSLEINDQAADESFTVYDHPKVIIYKKVNN